MTEQGRTMDVFRVVRDPNRTRVETIDNVLGWGVRFPSGLCYVDWNRWAYEPDDRLEQPHVSQYGTLEDVRQGTGGTVEVVDSFMVAGANDTNES